MIRPLSKHMAPWHTHVVGSLFILLLSMGVYLLEIGPLYGRYSDRHTRASQVAQQMNRTRDLDATLKQTRNSSAEMRTFLADHSVTLESRSRLNDRLTAICALATECGLIPEGIEPQRQVAEPLYTTIVLRLSGHGSYQSCVRFLQKLRSDMPHNTVAGIELSAAPSGKESSVNFNFQLIWHAAPTP